MTLWVYDLLLAAFNCCLSIFFREIHAVGASWLPTEGPVIIIAAPHHNQFVDPVLLMRCLKQRAGRRMSFLIAEKSLHQPLVGSLAKAMGALPVVRAMDKVKQGTGLIYLPCPTEDPCLVFGRHVDFTDATVFMVKGMIILPRQSSDTAEQCTIAEILGPTSMRLASPFKHASKSHPLHSKICQGIEYQVAPYINQADMFNAVYRGLDSGGCIGIFPEGGSHDRPSLLPLKAGAAIVALGTLARSSDRPLAIIPCGMNYFSPNKFRSRAVVEFGPPVQVRPALVESFKRGGQSKRDAVGSLLTAIECALETVTQQATDRETLMLVHTTRRLYRPLGMKLPLPLITEINRKLLLGYTRFKDHPPVVQLTKDIKSYHVQLESLGVRDHQVEWANGQLRPSWLVFATLMYRIGELILVSAFTLPSIALFWPVFLTTRVISHRKQREALAASVVKIEAKDVVGSWKRMVAMVFAPALYTWYTVVVTLWLSYNRRNGFYTGLVPWWLAASTYIPVSVSLWLFSISFFLLMVAVSFAGLRIGELGADILKSLPPLLIALNPTSSLDFAKLRAQRQVIADQVTKTINELLPEVYDKACGKSGSPRGDLEDPLDEPTYDIAATGPSRKRAGLRGNEVSASGNTSVVRARKFESRQADEQD
jgi:glycerol-3-phosphate O-acyltransferase/dihydroxyacetone phosphate acyltransferase